MIPGAGSLDSVSSFSWRRILQPYSGWIVLVVGMLSVLTLVDMIAPYFLKLLIDDVFPGLDGRRGNWHMLWVILPGIGLIYATRNCMFYLSRMRAMRISEDLCFDLRQRLFEHLQRMHLGYYRENRAGEISARVMDDTFKLQSFIQDKLPVFIRYLLELQVLLVIIYLVNWRLAIASTVILPLHFWVYRRYRRPMGESHSVAQQSLALVHGNMIEKFLGMEVVKGFSAEEEETRIFRNAIDTSRKDRMRSQRLHFTQKVAADLLVGLGTLILIGYAAFEVSRGRMTGGVFFMYFWYVKMLFPAVQEVISGTSHLTRAGTSADRVFQILDEPAGESIRVTRERALDLVGSIVLQDVSYCYPHTDRMVLDGINLHIQPGEKIAIIGPSGAGKSTLVSLLPRFIEPDTGCLLIDGHPVEDIPLASLRGLFGIVFQEISLFDTSIIENLRYGRPGATEEEIIEACIVTGAHDFIRYLPGGYDTHLGSGGIDLSRGEKQRLTLARALLRNPRILVLDESTASLDSPGASEVSHAIFRAMEGRTVIMVTHEEELLEMVDRVIFLEHGSVLYDGPRASFSMDELLRAAPAPIPIWSDPVVPRESAGARASSDLRSHTGDATPSRGSGSVRASSAILLACLLLCAGCTSIHRQRRPVLELRDPWISSGIMIEDMDEEQRRELISTLDMLPGPGGGSLPSRVDQHVPFDIEPARPGDIGPLPSAGVRIGGLNPRLDDEDLPDGSTRMFSLSRMTDVEMEEVLDHITMTLSAQSRYRSIPLLEAQSFPAPPGGVQIRRVLERREGGTRHDLIIIGTRVFTSLPTQVWVLGLSRKHDSSGEEDPQAPRVYTGWDAWTANPAVEFIDSLAQSAVGSMNEIRENLTAADLESRIVQLSYTDADTAIEIFKTMGYTVVQLGEPLPEEVEFSDLPYIIGLKDPDGAASGLVGQAAAGGVFGLSLTPNIANPLESNTLAAPMTQLLVIYHPAHPEQFSRVRRALDSYIDRPARLIFVEGMVLEISEQGLQELGIEWQFDSINSFLRMGSVAANSSSNPLSLQVDDLQINQAFQGGSQDWMTRIEALVRDSKAEILSRPSVLTLNNRQCTIRVGEDIPIATSQEGFANTNKVSFSFQYLPTGILLNIRPRINETGSEVSMLIDTVVSARVPGGDLEIRSADDEVLASAPTVSTRRVQTYARIENNTPLIIGGLVSRQEIVVEDKVPFLGDLPVLGHLFKATRKDKIRREVIIVLTPYVLPEEKLIARSLPRDEDYFDLFDHRLFRDSVRIRDADVFDLSFLEDNANLTFYREYAAGEMERNFRVVEREPFTSFRDNRIPGEDILVTRMIYEVGKRLDITRNIDLERLIYFESNESSGYSVRFLDTLLSSSHLRGWEDFFTRFPGEALAITFMNDRRARSQDSLKDDQIPTLTRVRCTNQEDWGRLLWDMNQPLVSGVEQHTILLHNEDDLLRLRRAVALKKIIDLNGGREELLLQNFAVGKLLLLPDFKQEHIHVIDSETAQLFYYSEHYYTALAREIRERVAELKQIIDSG